jgi:hypothetical protein
MFIGGNSKLMHLHKKRETFLKFTNLCVPTHYQIPYKQAPKKFTKIPSRLATREAARAHMEHPHLGGVSGFGSRATVRPGRINKGSVVCLCTRWTGMRDPTQPPAQTTRRRRAGVAPTLPRGN